jgi:HlyD family secretion protein
MPRTPSIAAKIARWVVLVLVLGGIGFGIWKWRTGKDDVEVTYKTAPVEKRKITARVTASGTLQATVTVQVGAQVSGRISELKVDFNSTVKKGQLIAKLDPQLFVAAAERERANFASAKAGVVRAEAQQRDAEMVQKRTKALQEQGLASAAELQTAETNVAVTAAATEVAKAALEQAKAAMNQAQVNLSYTNISSPIDGTVISRSVDVGQTVAASLQAPVLFTIAEDLRKMQVHTSVAEGDVGRLKQDMDATFTVDAFPGQRFKGKVGQIRNAAQTVQNVVTYDAVIDVDNSDLRLRPGMTATVTIIYSERPDAVAVPNAAMRFKPPAEALPSSSTTIASAATSGSTGRRERPSRDHAGGGGGAGEEGATRTVYVLRGGKPEPVSIKSGLSDGTVSEVVSGELKEGDQVVVDATVPGRPSGSAGPGGQQSGGRMGRMF